MLLFSLLFSLPTDSSNVSISATVSTRGISCWAVSILGHTRLPAVVAQSCCLGSVVVPLMSSQVVYGQHAGVCQSHAGTGIGTSCCDRLLQLLCNHPGSEGNELRTLGYLCQSVHVALLQDFFGGCSMSRSLGQKLI